MLSRNFAVGPAHPVHPQNQGRGHPRAGGGPRGEQVCSPLHEPGGRGLHFEQRDWRENTLIGRSMNEGGGG